ncbi:MAG: hypothetical protein GEV05_30470 [Betaproteobacteria bacterium]|nr:hypothetical protein [Betaproteobacteria bacterium]
MNTFAALVLTRVKPSFWHDAVRTEKGDGSFPVLHGKLMRVAAFISLSCIAVTQAHALAYLGSADQSGISIVVDGSNNTLLFGEETRVSLCIRGGQVLGDSPINDGSSNTIVFGEGVAVRANVVRIAQLAPVTQIADGTSNTIILGEIGMDFCLADITIPAQPIIDADSNTIVLDEQSEFDACFDRVRIGAVTDGTSNTVVFGEITDRSCYTGVSVPPESVNPVANVSEPVSLALVGIGMAILGLNRRHRSD